jgi:hypothetical protein
MTRKSRGKQMPGPEEKSDATKPGKRKSSLGHATSLLLIGGALLTSSPCQANDYELPYIKVEKKPEAGAAAQKFEESSQKACEQARSVSGKGSASRPDVLEMYYDSVLLDFKSLEQNIAITDCGYCQCTSCYCNACSASDCSCKEACHCSCDCDCSI